MMAKDQYKPQNHYNAADDKQNLTQSFHIMSLRRGIENTGLSL
jgi:hypothetical protein